VCNGHSRAANAWLCRGGSGGSHKGHSVNFPC
jgi:hypothetical protein